MRPAWTLGDRRVLTIILIYYVKSVEVVTGRLSYPSRFDHLTFRHNSHLVGQCQMAEFNTEEQECLNWRLRSPGEIRNHPCVDSSKNVRGASYYT